MAVQPRKSADILDAVALLVVDMQGPFLDVIEGASTVVERCGFAIEAARALGLRVLFTEQVPDKLGRTEPRLRALDPHARVFAKSSFSALQAEGLIDYLRRQGVYHLMVVGIEIPVCIYQTALHAIDSDFDVTVLSDCVTGRRLDDCLITLEALTRAHVHVLPAEAVFYSMLGHAGHPRFPAFNALVKRYAEPGALDAAPAAPDPVREPRPELAPAEDRYQASTDDGRDHESDHDDGEDGPYIGRDSAEPAPAGVGQDRGEDAGEDAGDGEGAGEDEGASDDREEPSATDESADGDGGGRRRRGRRRRGGARRRRARERSAGGPIPGGENAGPSTPARDGDAPVTEDAGAEGSAREASSGDEPAAAADDTPAERAPE